MTYYTCHPEQYSALSQNNDGIRYSNSEKEDKGGEKTELSGSKILYKFPKLNYHVILKVKITNMIKDTQILLLKTDAEIS